jgi:hypothetical protein
MENQIKEMGPVNCRGACFCYAHSCVRLLGDEVDTFSQRLSAKLKRGAFAGMIKVAFLPEKALY